MTSNQFVNGELSTVGQPSAVFPTIGHGGMVVSTFFVNSPLNLGGAGLAYRVVIEWASDPAFANPVARRQFCVMSGAAQGGFNGPDYGRATMATPHFGDFVRFTMWGPAGFVGVNGVWITAEHRRDALSWWSSPPSSGLITADAAFDLSSGLFKPIAAVNVVNGTTLTRNSLYPYEGEVTIHTHWNANAAAAGYRTALLAVSELGVTQELGVWDVINDPEFGTLDLNVRGFLVPPLILRLQLTNSTANPHDVTATVTPDLSRVGC